MKKMKLITPMLGVVALGSTIAPIATSCSSQTTETNIIPTDYLNIVGHRLKGFKKSKDISSYDTLVIPDTVYYINDEAFADVFVPGTEGGFIRKIVFPNTIKSIGKSAFKNCSAITTLDFSTWTIDHIRYCDMVDDEGYQAFEGWSDNGNLITNSDITKESKEELEVRLHNAGLYPTWFAEESTDKITPDSSWMSQNTETGLASFQFQLNQDLPADATNVLYGSVIWKNGTKGVSAITPDCKIDKVIDNKFSLPVQLVNHEKIGDYAEFDIAIGLMSNKTGEEEDWKPIWKQTMSGFKLNLINNVVKSVEISGAKTTIETEETLQLTATVSPEDATNKDVTWTSLNKDIATVDQNGLVTGVAKGTATIQCRALGGLDVKNTFTINVEQGPFNLELYELNGIPRGYTMLNPKTKVPTTMGIEKDEIYTFKIKLSKCSDGKLIVPDLFGFVSSQQLAMNENSIIIKCNGSNLEKGKGWTYTSSSGVIMFDKEYGWKVNDVLDITLSCSSSSSIVMPLGSFEITGKDLFGWLNKVNTPLPVENAIAGGADGLYAISPNESESSRTIQANRYFEYNVAFDDTGWGGYNLGKPTEAQWPTSEISMIYDFEDLSAIDLNTVKIYTSYSSKPLTLNTDYTLTKLSTNRIKITLKPGVASYDGSVRFYAFADKATLVKDAFMYADTVPTISLWQIKKAIILDGDWGEIDDYSMVVGKTGSSLIQAIVRNYGSTDRTVKLSLVDITGNDIISTEATIGSEGGYEELTITVPDCSVIKSHCCFTATTVA